MLTIGAPCLILQKMQFYKISILSSFALTLLSFAVGFETTKPAVNESLEVLTTMKDLPSKYYYQCRRIDASSNKDLEEDFPQGMGIVFIRSDRKLVSNVLELSYTWEVNGMTYKFSGDSGLTDYEGTLNNITFSENGEILSVSKNKESAISGYVPFFQSITGTKEYIAYDFSDSYQNSLKVLRKFQATLRLAPKVNVVVSCFWCATN